MSAATTGRRNARRARLLRMVRAQASSSLFSRGAPTPAPRRSLASLDSRSGRPEASRGAGTPSPRAARGLVSSGWQIKIFARLGVVPRPVALYGPPMMSCLTSGVPPGTSNRFTRAPFNLRSTGYGTCGTPPPRPPAPPPLPAPGASLSALRFSRGDVTPTACSPAFTGTRTW